MGLARLWDECVRCLLHVRGVAVTPNSRTVDEWNAAVADIRSETNVEVSAVVCDVTTPDGQIKLLKTCPVPNILASNAGGPPTGDFRYWIGEDSKRL